MSGIFGGGQKMPDPKPPTAMPDETDPAVLAAERKRRQGMMARGGRVSTILSSGAGGSAPSSNAAPEYSATKMG